MLRMREVSLAQGQDSTHCPPRVNNPFHGRVVKQCPGMQEEMELQCMLTAQPNAIASQEGCGDTVVACAEKICRGSHLCWMKHFCRGVPSL